MEGVAVHGYLRDEDGGLVRLVSIALVRQNFLVQSKLAFFTCIHANCTLCAKGQMPEGDTVQQNRC